MLRISLDDIIRRRKELWDKKTDIQLDKDFRNSVADKLLERESDYLRSELKENPEKLVELFFVIVNKDQETVPFFFNEVQEKFLNILNEDIKAFKQGTNNHLKYLVLKGRQQGFTSLINALEVAYAVCRENFSGFTLADSTDNAVDIFSDKGKFYFDNLPESFKPSTRYNTRRELDFNNEQSTGLNSKWRVGTAGNKDAGRSKTLNFFHGSEVAFWENAETLLTGLAEAFTKGAIIILETTANGFNYYKELWDSDNNYKNLFFEWWLTSEYIFNFENDRIKSQFLRNIDTGLDKEPDDVQSSKWIFARLKYLRDKKGLNNNQLYWYYNKWKDKGETIKQEYPCSAEEAFLASGRNYFAISEVIKRIDAIKDIKPLRRGYFMYQFGTSINTGEKIIKDETITFVDDDRGGYIDIFLEHDKSQRFVLCGDTAGDGSDYNAGHVLNANGGQYATIHLINDEDLYADQLYCLGKYFNEALIAVESNFSTYVNKTLQNREYPNLYTRVTAPDDITQDYQQKLGFNTNKATRPVLLGQLRELVRDNVNYINDIKTLEEMLTFVISDKAKPEAMVGYHDDLIMAYGIGLYCLEQIPPEEVVREVIPAGFYTKEELEDLGYPNYMIRAYMANGGGKIYG